MTINETSFFRDDSAFEALNQPAAAKRRLLSCSLLASVYNQIIEHDLAADPVGSRQQAEDGNS